MSWRYIAMFLWGFVLILMMAPSFAGSARLAVGFRHQPVGDVVRCGSSQEASRDEEMTASCKSRCRVCRLRFCATGPKLVHHGVFCVG